MKITPSLTTAALAGLFSAAAWPWLWSRYGVANANGVVELALGTVLLVGLPAHAFVVGFGASGRGVDKPLLLRIAAWLLAAAAMSLVGLVLRG
ncbi:hypothetical protein [Pelomonas sp. SE-A7]|uniref:hypothetical protein n=1 Tax=Pelomonas sp. SE-A7 TaxID=3054953 RepID=UPI00259CED59|nr:hypothetical protein [Pelomonas sp. SE-A7]MDM4766589.1 hypothetical protein [Pelomonas sp. SE-A7]